MSKSVDADDSRALFDGCSRDCGLSPARCEYDLLSFFAALSLRRCGAGASPFDLLAAGFGLRYWRATAAVYWSCCCLPCIHHFWCSLGRRELLHCNVRHVNLIRFFRFYLYRLDFRKRGRSPHEYDEPLVRARLSWYSRGSMPLITRLTSMSGLLDQYGECSGFAFSCRLSLVKYVPR